MEHLSALEYQIKQDKQRLKEINKRVSESHERYEVSEIVHTTKESMGNMGKKKEVSITKNFYPRVC